MAAASLALDVFFARGSRENFKRRVVLCRSVIACIPALPGTGAIARGSSRATGSVHRLVFVTAPDWLAAAGATLHMLQTCRSGCVTPPPHGQAPHLARDQTRCTKSATHAQLLAIPELAPADLPFEDARMVRVRRAQIPDRPIYPESDQISPVRTSSRNMSYPHGGRPH
jgi:hypothetical protein